MLGLGFVFMFDLLGREEGSSKYLVFIGFCRGKWDFGYGEFL